MSNPTIRVLESGPYEVRGCSHLVDRKGGSYIGQKDPLYLCRCGQSKNKPYCDGTHHTTAFSSDEGAPPEDVQ